MSRRLLFLPPAFRRRRSRETEGFLVRLVPRWRVLLGHLAEKHGLTCRRRRTAEAARQGLLRRFGGGARTSDGDWFRPRPDGRCVGVAPGTVRELFAGGGGRRGEGGGRPWTAGGGGGEGEGGELLGGIPSQAHQTGRYRMEMEVLYGKPSPSFHHCVPLVRGFLQML